MLYAKVLYPPQFGATLVSLDARGGGSHAGREGGARGRLRRRRGARIPTPPNRRWPRSRREWKPVHGRDRQPQRLPSISGRPREQPAARPPSLTPYTIAYIAHVPLEPRAAVAEWEGDKLTVWTGTQRPFGVRSELAQEFRIAEENARVIVPDTGSGYGGKHNGDAALEAARIAKAAGKPVKRNWTREEEIDLGLLPSRRPDRGRGQGGVRRHDHRVGVPQLQLGRHRAADRRTSIPARRSSTTGRTRRCGRAPTAAWRPRRITSCANPTWTNWRTR